MIFLKNYLIIKWRPNVSSNGTMDEDNLNFEICEEEEEAIEDATKSKETKSFRERLNEIQEICLKIQESLEYAASFGERVIKYYNIISLSLSLS